jgi:hypothetical protein
LRGDVRGRGGTKQRGDAQDAEQRAYDQKNYGCPYCGTVVIPGVRRDAHTQHRVLANREIVFACQPCYRLLDRDALDHLADELLPDGRRRIDAIHAHRGQLEGVRAGAIGK